jgi:hypothetical protein
VYPRLESALDHVDTMIIAKPLSTYADLALTALASGRSVQLHHPRQAVFLEAIQALR